MNHLPRDLQRGHHVILTDRLGTTTWVNALFSAHTGYSLSDMLGRSPGSVLQGPETSPEARAAMRQAILAAEPIYGVEVVNYRKDRTPFRVRLDIEPQFDAEGELVGFVSAQTDVTEEQITRRRVQVLQRWLSLIQEDTTIGIFERNCDTDTAWNDPYLLTLWGLPENITDTSLAAFRACIVPEDREQCDRLWASSLANPGVHESEFRVRDRQGRLRWIRSHWAVEVNSHQERIAVGTARDVTNVVQRREALAEERQQLLQAAELTGVGLLKYELNGWVSACNSTARRLYGVGQTEVLTFDYLLTKVHPDDRTMAQSAWRSLLADDPAGERIGYRVCHEDGRVLHLMSTRHSLRDKNGRPIAFKSVIQDVTQQVQAADAKALAQRLQMELDQSASVSAMRHSVLAAVSHEVRTPLNAIAGAVEQLSRAPDGARPDQQKWLRILYEATHHLHGVANDLLSGLQVEAALGAEPSDSLSLTKKVSRAFDWLQGAAETAQVRLLMDPSLEGVTVAAPRRKLRQVLLNLVSNGIKYNRPGGWVRCSASTGPDGMVSLLIEDNGIGMTAEQRDRLFRPFERLGREQGQVQGFGLGLYLVQRFLLEMGGTVTVSSEPGRGSTFTLRLPSADSDASVLDASAVFPPGSVATRTHLRPILPGDTIRVLCVEDNTVMAAVLEAQLGSLGIELSIVSSLESALAWLKANTSPHLLMLDQNLSGVLGTDVLYAIRLHGCNSPAVAYTGDGDPTMRSVLLSSGFSDVWIKPMDGSALALAIGKALGATVA